MISIGCDRETACKYLGLTSKQLSGLLEQDPEFLKQLSKAEATSELTHMQNLRNAAKDEKHWRASVWWLERHAPERYARRAPDTLTVAQLQQIIEELVEAIVCEVTNERDRLRLLNRFEKIALAAQQDSYEEIDTPDLTSGEENLEG